MRARGRAGRAVGRAGPGRAGAPRAVSAGGSGGGASRDGPSPAPRPGGDGRAEPGTGIMSLVISVYPVEVTALPVTGAGDPGRWCRGWAGAPGLPGVPGTGDPAGQSCP